MDGVEAVAVAQKVVRGLRAAADAGELGDAVRLDVELPEGLDQRGGDRVVAAAGAERADLAFVVAAGEAELVLRQCRVVELRLRDVRHSLASLLRSRGGVGLAGLLLRLGVLLGSLFLLLLALRFLLAHRVLLLLRKERRGRGGDRGGEKERDDLGHAALSFRMVIGRTFSAVTISAISFWM